MWSRPSYSCCVWETVVYFLHVYSTYSNGVCANIVFSYILVCVNMFLPPSYVCAEACVGSTLDFWDGKTAVEWSEDLEDNLSSQILDKTSHLWTT